ncbi:D-alanyl-D-alanine serine-type carboxypeptidase [Saccharibacter floricola DSM 15669]|uniref:D-alanyl-D-alanine serine-type carboxypeptidase n=2 Tax=Saccharibacter TaxID=231052 RepID=A0ABQ0P0T2_9PROT|nr:D-alanyl-D-alanine serine-type carboxypeptidase [Saccharibacter floricola DSM 15669]
MGFYNPSIPIFYSFRHLSHRLIILMPLMRCFALLFSLGLTLFASGTARAQYVGHLSGFVMDAHTGAVLSETDADLQRYPASLTKMMTLYLTFQALEQGRITLGQRMPVSIHASLQKPSKLGMRPGSFLTVEQGILALVTKSANDAACTLGEFLGGGDETRFAAYMTSQARRLGMSNTTFQNASGLPDPDQVTTARDLARLARHLMTDYPQYYSYFSTEQFVFHRRIIANHNPMLKLYAGADGLKTGFTDLAGHNLVSSARQGRIRLIGVVMGAESNTQRNNTMIAMLNRGFEAEGQAPQPLLKSPSLVASGHTRRWGRRTVPHFGGHRHRVVLVSYRPRVLHGRVTHRTSVSHRGHHRS